MTGTAVPPTVRLLLSGVDMTFRTLARITSLPRPFDTERATVRRERWLAAVNDEISHELSRDATGSALLDAVFGNSPFLSQGLVRHPGAAARWALDGPQPCVENALRRLSPDLDRIELLRALRTARTEVAIAVALADISGIWQWRDVTAALSAFAERACRAAVGHLLLRARSLGRIGDIDPDDPERDSGFVVLGLGKLGGRELNYSSDIDLIVLWDDERFPCIAEDGAGPVCVRLARELIALLEERTADGYALRTDLRLRPDPAATPLAVSADAAEVYYESLGQNWERAAMIKARPVAGDIEAGDAFLDRLRPFIWRRHLDFAAIQDIHAIKRRIHAHKGGGEVRVPGHDIKLGRGGIREIEFFVQAQQLIFGGREPGLRRRATCDALEALADAGRIDHATRADLDDAYGELRRMEHRLQMVDNAQTHSVPSSDEGLDHIAAFLGHDGREAFAGHLGGILRRVEARYAGLFETPSQHSGDGNGDDPDVPEPLAHMGFADGAAAAAIIGSWQEGKVRATRSDRAREILARLLPGLLRAFAATASPDETLKRFHGFLAGLPAGVQLLSLLERERTLLDLVAEIMATAPRLAERLAETPVLLDYVLSREFLSELPQAGELEAELCAVLHGAEHEEDLLDLVRRWVHDLEFRLAVHLLQGRMPAERMARCLADIGDAVLKQMMPRIEAGLAAVHGRIPGGAMAIMALGRYGIRELDHDSRLDLAFVYDCDEDAAMSDGPRPLAANRYYARLSQRLITALTAPTNAGHLFRIDVHRVSSGGSGPLACTAEHFVRSCTRDASPGELLALTEARIVAAPEALGRRLGDAVREALAAPHDPAALADAVVDMRMRIAAEHPPGDCFDARHAAGGLIDLDLAARYLQLVHGAAAARDLPLSTEDVLTSLAASGALDREQAADLIEVRLLLRDVETTTRLALAQPAMQDDLSRPLRDLLARVTGSDDHEALRLHLESGQSRTGSLFERIVAGRITPPAWADQSDEAGEQGAPIL